MRRRSTPLLLVAVALGGCGVGDPYADNTIGGPKRPPAESSPKTPPPAPVQGPPARTPRARSAPERAGAAYAVAQGNYTPQTYRRQYRAMVALAAGPLRAELTRTPLTVIARGIEEAGASAATSVLATRPDPGQGGERAVTIAARQVVRTTSEAGRPGAEYLYFRAALRRVRGGWRVARFEALR